MTRISVSKLTLIGSDNGLSPGRRQAIIWTNAGILLIGPVGANFSAILIEIYSFSFKKLHLKISSAKWRPCCLGLNVLSVECLTLYPPPPPHHFAFKYRMIYSKLLFDMELFFFFSVLYCIIHLCCPGSIPLWIWHYYYHPSLYIITLPINYSHTCFLLAHDAQVFCCN